MTIARTLLQPLICAALAVLLSYVMLGPLWPAIQRWNLQLPTVAAAHAAAADAGPHHA